MESSDGRRLSVTLVDVAEGCEAEFRMLATHFEATLIRKDYGRVEMIRDEAMPRRFYAVRYWVDAGAAERAHHDPEVQHIIARMYQVARIIHLVNGVRRADAAMRVLDDRRARLGPDRRSGFDRRAKNVTSPI